MKVHTIPRHRGEAPSPFPKRRLPTRRAPKAFQDDGYLRRYGRKHIGPKRREAPPRRGPRPPASPPPPPPPKPPAALPPGAKPLPPSVMKQAAKTLAKYGLRYAGMAGWVMTAAELIKFLLAAIKYALWYLFASRAFPGYRIVCGGGGVHMKLGALNCALQIHHEAPSVTGSDHNLAARLIGIASDINLYDSGPALSKVQESLGNKAITLKTRLTKDVTAAPILRAVDLQTQLSTMPLPQLVTALDPALWRALKPHLDPAVQDDLLLSPDPAPFRPAPVPDPLRAIGNNPRRVITIALPSRKPKPETVRALPPKFPPSAPPPRGTREVKPSSTRRFAATVFRNLDRLSETAEVVSAIYAALPCEIQCSYNRQGRGLLDQAGQYGVDGADWKSEAIIKHFDRIDWGEALVNIARNEVEDRVIGKINAEVRRVYKGPANSITSAPGQGVSALLGGKKCSC